jgi:hypothetical protein
MIPASILAGWLCYWVFYALVRSLFGKNTNAWTFVLHFFLHLFVFWLVRSRFVFPQPILWFVVGPLAGAWFQVLRITRRAISGSPAKLKTAGIALTLGLTHFLAQSGAGISIGLGLLACLAGLVN